MTNKIKVRSSGFRRMATSLVLMGALIALTACPSEGDSGPGDALLPLLLSGGGTPPSGGSGGGGGTINPGAPSSSPFSVSATPGNGTVNLTWSYFGSGATRFIVYYSTSNNVTESSTKVETTDTTMAFTHTGLTNGTTYYYRVAAANDAGRGLLSTTSVAAGPDAWTAATSGTANTLNSVRYLNSEFWAVGANRTILRSSDGISWSAVAPGCGSASATLHDIAHDGGNKFRIAGTGGLLIKSDNNATSWTCDTINAAQNYEGIHYADSLWLLAGTDTGNTIMFVGLSTDGNTFAAAATTAAFSFYSFRDIAYYSSSGTYVVTGDDGIIARCTSSCGTNTNWSFTRITSFGFGVTFYGHYFRNSKWNFMGSSVYTLDTNFSNLDSMSDDNANARRLVDRGTEILTAGTGGRIYSSGDGIDFTQRGQSATTQDLYGLACSTTRCVAAGSSGTIIYR